jgi:organic radical activating enzyme
MLMSKKGFVASRRTKSLRIPSLGLHLTDQCDARCLHCAYHCGPHVGGVMGLEEAQEYLRTMTDQRLEMVAISGGEPCLYFGLVLDVIREARRLGVPSVWVFTNAFWAADAQAARANVGSLKQAGATRLCLSADGFHEPFVQGQKVRQALQAARDAGLELAVDVRFLGGPEATNSINRVTQRIMESLGTLEGVEVWRGSPRYIGRAAEALSSLLEPQPGVPQEECPGPWAGGTWASPAGVDVDSFGEVTLCPGISLGNARERPLTRILAGYAPSNHPIIRELIAGGPARLALVAERSGYVPLPGYLDMCHLCYDVRKFLRNRYPSELAPVPCYEEMGSAPGSRGR